jgi:hypothetical protein
MRMNDGYVSENKEYYFRRCDELGLYCQSRVTWVVIQTHLTDYEFKSMCYGIH